ncbi:MAG: metallophosphoesterase [Pseudomonadota bacterium]
MKCWTGRCALAFALAMVSLGANAAEGAEGAFALLGDPQIGYGPGAEYADAVRFGHVVDDVNSRGLGLTVIAGDLVQDRSLWQNWAFSRVVRRLHGSVLLVPGNHDIVDAPSLAEWRKRHGPDYRELLWHETAFIALDSETLRDTRISVAENAAQWSFLERSLASHKAAGRKHIVLAMHRPPFATSEDEPESDSNWPPAARTRLLSLARNYGVRLILAGHLHRTAEMATQDGIRIVVGAGSASSFDRSPIGYHLIRIDNDLPSVERVVVEPAPRAPFAVPGIPGWTPRLLDFSLRHWLFTIIYGVAGAQAFALARRRKSSRWLVVAITLFFFAANMQLDFDEFLRETGRVGAQLTGIYAVRHLITSGATFFMAAAAILMFARNWTTRGSERLSLLALGLLAPSTAWFELSVISHHDWGMLFNEGWWDLLILSALMGILACGAYSWRALKQDA